jgi:hypothetical protein
MSTFDESIRSALTAFADEELDGSWNGKREREAVSLFSFGSLVHEVSPEGDLYDSKQIGLEVPVPQVTAEGEDAKRKKNQVCKDVVIWPNPRMTCWDTCDNPTVPPAVVIEWKFDRASIYDYDVTWLESFTKKYPDCTGYAVTANQPSTRFSLSCTRIADGQRKPEWLYIS